MKSLEYIEPVNLRATNCSPRNKLVMSNFATCEQLGISRNQFCTTNFELSSTIYRPIFEENWIEPQIEFSIYNELLKPKRLSSK